MKNKHGTAIQNSSDVATCADEHITTHLNSTCGGFCNKLS